MTDTRPVLEEWCCRGCDGAFSGAPPWHRLCLACLASIKAQGLFPDPSWPEDVTPPVCQDCGERLVPVILITRGEADDDDE
jgi:hypothetical protein